MEIAYQSKWCTLYHGDALEVARAGIEPYQLLVTDPPYGQKYKSSRRTKTEAFEELIGDDGTLDVNTILAQVMKPLQRTRHVYIFGPFEIGDLKLTKPVQLIWDKGVLGPGNLKSPWGPQHEPITFATYQISKANREAGFGQLSARLRQGSVIRVQRKHSGQVTKHPTEKPVELMMQLIESSSLRGETVCDPFAGSGSTLVAAILLGRRAIGIEIDKQYIQGAIERIQKAESILEQMQNI